MNELAAQFAFLDSLIEEWQSIRLLMEPVTAALDTELAQLAISLRQARTPDEVAVITNRLLRATLGTPAHSFVKDLIRRSRDGVDVTRGHGFAAQPLDPAMEKGTTQAGNALGQTVAEKSKPLAVPVFFCTNRNLTSPGMFGSEYGELRRGLARVTIPVAHKPGRVETPEWWTLFPGRNSGDRFVLIEGVEDLSLAEFNTRVERALREKGTAADLLIFLHGYRVTFEQAARRAAQLAYDLEFPGIVCLFSWPSLGTFLGYDADCERSQSSAKPLASFLRSLEGGAWRKIHLVAHSMGNRVLTHGLADSPAAKIPLGQVVFAAADIDREIFRQNFPSIPTARDRATSYVSKNDRALQLSSFLHRLDRIGLFEGEPLVLDGLETVDASAVDSSLLGLNHGYFGDEISVLTDLAALIRLGSPPEGRGLRLAPDKRYWILLRRAAETAPQPPASSRN